MTKKDKAEFIVNGGNATEARAMEKRIAKDREERRTRFFVERLRHQKEVRLCRNSGTVAEATERGVEGFVRVAKRRGWI